MKYTPYSRCAGIGYGPRESCVEPVPCAPSECKRRMAVSDVVRNPHPGREAYRARLKEITRRLGPLVGGMHTASGTWSAAQSAELARRLVEVVTLLGEVLADPDVGSLP